MSKLLDDLRDIASTCTSCRLHKTRKHVVFDRGPASAPLMLVGESPGQDEDAQGYPFVGKSGNHLSALLRAAGVPEDQVYICNVLKCRSPDNRFPEDEEEPEICRKYLIQQIELVKPKAILLAGKQALKYVLLHGTTEDPQPFTPWVNKQYRRRDLFGDIRIGVIYHPAYLMRRNDEIDEEAWVQMVAGIWSYVQHKLNETAPAPVPFRDIRPAPKRPRMGRNLFGRSRGFGD